LGAALGAAACRGGDEPARIAYPLAWLGPDIGRVAQAAIADDEGRPVVDIPLALMDQRRAAARQPGYAAEVAYAEAMLTIPHLAAMVGHLSSRGSLLAAPIYSENRIPFIVPTGTSRRIRAVGPWTFQLAPDDSEEGAFIAHYVLDRLAARRVTIFYLVADEYGIGLRDGVVAALRARGVEPVDQVGILDDSDFPKRFEASLRRGTPEVVVIAARTREAAAIAKAVHGRLPGARMVAGDGVSLQAAFANRAGPAAASVIAVAWWNAANPDTISRAFVARFGRLTGHSPTAVDAMFYDGLMVAAQAVRDVGARPAAIRAYLRGLGSVRPPYHGVTGPISFAPLRPINLVMTRLEAGVAVLAGPN
jgi:ABC-type branched-subunit amino acid transport system substrate-binding protein